MVFHVITLFPKSFSSYLNESIIARAVEKRLIKVKFYNPRDFTKDKRARVDRRPYGGGPGMVLEAPALIKAVEAALKSSNGKGRVFIMSAGRKQFSNETAKKLAHDKDVIIVCGRYEGLDSRVKKIFKAKEYSVGPYVLTGGELPAMVVIDSVSRQIRGVLGNFDSLEENRVSSHDVYTRPEVIEYKGKKYRVPRVLVTGHHKKIEEWKAKKWRK